MGEELRSVVAAHLSQLVPVVAPHHTRIRSSPTSLDPEKARINKYFAKK